MNNKIDPQNDDTGLVSMHDSAADGLRALGFDPCRPRRGAQAEPERCHTNTLLRECRAELRATAARMNGNVEPYAKEHIELMIERVGAAIEGIERPTLYVQPITLDRLRDAPAGVHDLQASNVRHRGFTAELYCAPIQLSDRIAALEDLLTSVHAIAKRRGDSTAWDRLAARIASFGIGSITAKTFRILPDDEPQIDAAAQRDMLRSALAKMVGCDTKDELEEMELLVRALPAPYQDKIGMIDGIQALLHTLPGG